MSKKALIIWDIVKSVPVDGGVIVVGTVKNHPRMVDGTETAVTVKQDEKEAYTYIYKMNCTDEQARTRVVLT